MTFDAELRNAIQHQHAGRLAEAEAIYRRVLQASPRHPDALHLLGMVALEAGNPSAAFNLISQALAIMPRSGVFLTNLGLVLQRLERINEALAAMREGLLLQPNLPIARVNYAALLREVKDFNWAAEVLRTGLALSPNDTARWHDLGLILQESGRKPEAIVAYERVLALNPAHVEAINNLAAILRETGRAEESLALCRRAVEIEPRYAAAWTNLASALNDLRRPAEAIEAYDRALALHPPFAVSTRLNRAMALLMLGRFREGFAEYEVRTELLPPVEMFEAIAPTWDGSDLHGKTILLWSEQGFGDAIQFARYAKQVADRGGRVLMAPQVPLLELMRTAPGVSGPMLKTERGRVDAQFRLLSLPRLLGTNTIADIPNAVPYLSATEERIAAWAARIGPPDGRLRVGIAWSADPVGLDATKKSIPMKSLANLCDVQGVALYSLQKDRPTSAIEGRAIVDLTAGLTDFAETAALIHHLDLVISIDTAVCHLAGAMGKPVWTMLAHAADWRWLMDRDDSPWYPTMQLFRQPAAGDWEHVIAKVEEELRLLATAR